MFWSTQTRSYKRKVVRCSSFIPIKAALAKEVLAEVPDQVTSYMFDNNIIPNNAPPPYTPSTNDGVYETPYN